MPKKKNMNRVSVQMWVGLIVGFILIMCCICFGFYLLFTSTTDNSSTPTPVFINTEPLPVILATATAISSSEFVSTLTVTSLPPPTLASTWTPEPTFTPFILPTVQIITPPVSTGCSCNADTYNCSDFPSQSSAQACFNTCVAEGKGDIHRLDENNNGIACESN